MTSFIQIQIGSKVFDHIEQIQGVVTDINYKTNVASITTGSPSEDEVILCKLSNLTVLGKSNSHINQPTEYQYDFNKWYKQVKEFHVAFNHPVADKPTPITLERMTSRKIWSFEEGIEAIHASSSNIEEFNEAVDRAIRGIEHARTKSLGEEFPKDDVERLVAQADALTDENYFLQGDFVELGITPDEPFDIVQKSNMSKLFTASDGSKYAEYRESDGKILKSPEFFPPESALEEEIKRQFNNK